jgi:hypothetical protein
MLHSSPKRRLIVVVPVLYVKEEHLFMEGGKLAHGGKSNFSVSKIIFFNFPEIATSSKTSCH